VSATEPSAMPSQHFAGLNTSLLFRYIADELPAGSADELIRRAGEQRTVAQLADPGTWSSYDQFRRILETASSLFGGAAFLETAAGSGLDDPTMPELTLMLQSLGSPEALLAMLTEAGSASLATITAIRGSAVGAAEWRVELQLIEGYEPFRENCAWSVGLFTSIPKLFGFRADVIEEACQCDGAEACVVRVRWSAVDGPDATAFLEQRNSLLAARLESLQETVADLVSGEDLAHVLTRILSSAGRALHATNLVLALEADAPTDRQVFALGAGDDADAIAAELLAHGGEGPRRLVVDVESRAHYGRLAAINPGADFFPQEREVLQAHARLAGAALDGAAALADARREARTSAALLHLANALAELATFDEIAVNIAQAVPAVIGCDRAAVLVYEPDAPHGRVVASHGYKSEDDIALRSMEVPLPRPRAGDSGVTVWDRDSASHFTLLSRLMEELGSVAVATVPILIDGALAGLVVADVTQQPDRLLADRELHDRLRGLASQSTIAMRNARLLDEIRHQALHDSLTGLPNRALILDRAEQMIVRARRNNTECAALYIDLDGFKQVNDTLGHDGGDRLLKTVASRLQSALRESDSIARIGGDEFVALVEGSHTASSPQFVAERIMEVLKEPFEINDTARGLIAITASIGIASGRQGSATDLLRDADIALYEAKAAGRNCFVHFERSMHTAVEDRVTLELDLRAALGADQFFLMYQPIFDLETRSPLGIEALIRWNHPRNGLVQPDAFIPVLEETRMIVEVGRWVLTEACRKAVEWRLHDHNMYMSVNVSVRQLDDERFVDDVRRVIDATGIDPTSLVLEITETAIMSDPQAIARKLEAIKKLGVSVAIDDFGTGYSSLAYLRQFPIDILKIDRSFIASMKTDESAALIRTLVQLGKQLGLRTLAEGIEDQEQYDRLQQEDCDSGQGFMLARPLSVAAVEEFVATLGNPRLTAPPSVRSDPTPNPVGADPNTVPG
jgi:diguanylate cyclase (GGDEF)-like protein